MIPLRYYLHRYYLLAYYLPFVQLRQGISVVAGAAEDGVVEDGMGVVENFHGCAETGKKNETATLKKFRDRSFTCVKETYFSETRSRVAYIRISVLIATWLTGSLCITFVIWRKWENVTSLHAK